MGRAEDFGLIETIRFQASGTFPEPDGSPVPTGGDYWLLGLHLERLAASAAHFGFHFDETRICQALASLKKRLREGLGMVHRVRLVLFRSGRLEITHEPLRETEVPVRVGLALCQRPEPEEFIRHKTTNREFLNQLSRRSIERGLFDTLILVPEGKDFLLEGGGGFGQFDRDTANLAWLLEGPLAQEIVVTEGAITNLFMMPKGLPADKGDSVSLWTPRAEQGRQQRALLLPGVLRRFMLESGRVQAYPITLAELARARAVWVGNSLRGLLPAIIEWA